MKTDTTLLSMTQLNDTEKEMILEWRNHKDIRKWMYNSETIDKETHFNFIEKLKQDSQNKYFLVKHQNNYLGVVYFNHIDLRLNKSHFGLYANPNLKGIGNMLMHIIIEYAFEILKVKRLIAEVFESNSKAIDLYERFGFKSSNGKIVNENSVLCMELKNEYR